MLEIDPLFFDGNRNNCSACEDYWGNTCMSNLDNLTNVDMSRDNCPPSILYYSFTLTRWNNHA
jgi:hypothetical protein